MLSKRICDEQGRQATISRRAVIVLTSFVAAWTTAQSAWAVDDAVRALYYNARGELLQVEEVSQATMATRTLVDIDDAQLPVPLTTPLNAIPLISGTSIPMSKDAVIAVYYTFQTDPPPGATDVHVFPTKVEYLEFVPSRTLGTCLGPSDPHACTPPKRCVCLSACCCM